ncbi:hypothetical protein P4T04_06450 [Bacillus badius]|uniref:hypothetical protein n=1 Tax=Bacillus badius TaxID=1455 RepID=UPI002E1D1138|nr:hypothetical protein [Bacillus badius]
MNEKTLTGNLTYNAPNADGTITLDEGRLAGDLTVNTPKASFVNNATVTGTTTITDVASHTFTNNGSLQAVVINDANGTRFVNGAEATVGTLTIGGAVDAEGAVLLEGKFNQVTVERSTTITLVGSVSTLEVKEGSEVKVEAKDGEETPTIGEITGEGTVDTTIETEKALAVAKTQAKETLKGYKNAQDYQTNAEALTNAITAGEEAIDAAKTPEEVTTALNKAKGAIDAIKSDAQTAAETVLTEFLTTAKSYTYSDGPSQGNYKELADLIIEGAAVTADMTNDTLAIKTISEKQGIISAADQAGKDVIDYATDLYVMNTMARYLGTLNYKDAGATVKEIKYNGVSYTWQQKPEGGYLKGSNWRDASGTTLVSVIAADENTSIRTVNLTLVDADGYSINATFKANVPTKEDVQAAQ